MGKKHVCAWVGLAENRARLHDYLAILRRGVPEELQTLPQDFLDGWRSANAGAGAFHYVATHGHNATIASAFLVSRGMDPNALSLKGTPVLAHALNRSKAETLEWCQALEEAGARVELMPCRGVSLLVAGVSANRPELVRFAVERGATRIYPKEPQFKFKPLPDQLVIHQSRPGVPLLAGAQALEDLLPPTQADLDRLFLASVRAGCFAWAEHFLLQGASVHALTDGQETVLHLLAERVGSHRRWEDPVVMDWVYRAAACGVDAHAVNHAGRTALDVLVQEWDLAKSASKFQAKVIEGVAVHLSGHTHPASATRARARI